MSRIAESSSLTSSIRGEHVWLHRLITLGNVGDPEADETARFMMIDPLDPLVEELCIQADRLFDLLVMLTELHPDCDIIAPEIFDPSAA